MFLSRYLLIFCFFLCSFCGSSLLCAAQEKPLVIVIPSYNNKSWYQRNLDSVFDQNYSNYRVIYIDDCSPDGTGELVQTYVHKKGMAAKTTLILNPDRRKALANLYNAIHQCYSAEIVVTLDGDDWFSHDNVLSHLNQKYQDSEVWLTYGQFAYVFQWDQPPVHGICSEIPADLLLSNKYRVAPNGIPSQLRTFYAGLFHNIKKEDFFFEGDFFPIAYDVAMMIPMIEMAGTHCHFISEVLYMYNRLNPINDDKLNGDLQTAMDIEVRSRKSYNPITTYLPTISDISR